MRRLKIVFLLLSISFYHNLYADQPSGERSFYTDAKRSFSLIFEGAYRQFQVKNNLYYLVPGVASTWYAFENDQRISDRAREQRIRGHVQLTSDLGVLFNFPFAPAGIYAWSRYNDDNHMAQFAMEYFATLYLTLGETGLLSFIDIHERPEGQDNSNFWETAFRGDSSFPSGHIVPYTTLFFKTLQFYGPAWSIAPAVLSVWASTQRVRDGKHYLSDVIGTVFLSAFASEGVRLAANYDSNHPFYRRFFERDIHVGLTSYRGVLGPHVSWSF